MHTPSQWQKARLIHLYKNDPPTLLGRELWVRGRPHTKTILHGYNQQPEAPGLSFDSNLYTTDDQYETLIQVRVESIELLPEFCENPALILLADFLQEEAGHENSTETEPSHKRR